LKYPDMKGTPHLSQRQLDLGDLFVQQGTEAEGKGFGNEEPTWIG
jgi:hypothetical protein